MKQIFYKWSLFLLALSAWQVGYGQEVSDYSSLTAEDYKSLTLPPLDVLFENAKGAPSYELAEVQELIEKKILAKEKRAVLSFFNIRGGYQWGKFGSDQTFSDISTPIINNYVTSKQQTYTVGASVSIPLDDVFDLVPRIRRQKLNVRAAELQKNIRAEEVKKEIVQLYVTANSQLNVLKLRAESLTLASAQYDLVEKDFASGMINTSMLAEQKTAQSVAQEAFERSKSELIRSLMTLEIITCTPIIKK